MVITTLPSTIVAPPTTPFPRTSSLPTLSLHDFSLHPGFSFLLSPTITSPSLSSPSLLSALPLHPTTCIVWFPPLFLSLFNPYSVFSFPPLLVSLSTPSSSPGQMITLLPGVFGMFLHQLLSCVLHLFPMLVASCQLAIDILPMSVISVSWVVFVSASRLYQYVSNLLSLCCDTANLHLDVVIKYRRTINVDLFVIL